MIWKPNPLGFGGRHFMMTEKLDDLDEKTVFEYISKKRGKTFDECHYEVLRKFNEYVNSH
jgi:hypothetical protein